MVTVTRGRLEFSQWHQFAGDRDPDRACTPLAALLDNEIEALVCSDAEPCFVVSGGLDSSLVASMANDHVVGMHTFSVGYSGDWPADETSFSVAVSEHLSSVHHHVVLDPLDIPDLLPRVIRHMGQPHGSPIAVCTYLLFSAINSAGFRVALTGDGADELFLGYQHAHRALRSGPEGWLRTYLADLVHAPQRLRFSLYTDDYTAHVRGFHETTFAFDPGSAHCIANGLARLELSTKFPHYHLRRVDHLSMAHGVEARLPYLQPRIVDHALALTEGEMFDGIRGKLPLLHAAQGRLPRTVQQRPKQPVHMPIGLMLASLDPLRDFVLSVLTDDRVAARGQLQPRALEKLIKTHCERPTDLSTQTIWSMLVYELWRRHQERETIRPIASA
jgi:asparagine synthase (glutamine-hydrolysing)